MTSLDLVQLAIGTMVALNVLMLVTTLGIKSAMNVRVSWRTRHAGKIEPAIERYLLTGDDQPELETLRPRQISRFVSPLIVERMALVRGTDRERLVQLAHHLGLADRYRGELHARGRWKRAGAAEYLGFIGGPGIVAVLGRILRDEDETVRAVAARALARIGTPDAAHALAATLGDPSELTRLRVAENLERIGSPSVAPLVAVLEGSLISEDPHRRLGAMQAAQVLGQLRAPEAQPALCRAAHSGANVDLRATAIVALGTIGDPDDVTLLREAAEDDAWPVRAQAANALGMIGDISTIPMLTGLMSDREWWVRLNAGRALGNMGLAGERALIQVLAGADPFARDRAAATLEARGTTRRLATEICANGPRGERARHAILALIRAGATKHLKRQAQTMPEGECRTALQRMLADAP